MKYISTRGESEPCSFDDTLLLSIASDEGLFYPESIPKVDEKTLEEWSVWLSSLHSNSFMLEP